MGFTLWSWLTVCDLKPWPSRYVWVCSHWNPLNMVIVSSLMWLRLAEGRIFFKWNENEMISIIISHDVNNIWTQLISDVKWSQTFPLRCFLLISISPLTSCVISNVLFGDDPLVQVVLNIIHSSIHPLPSRLEDQCTSQNAHWDGKELHAQPVHLHANNLSTWLRRIWGFFQCRETYYGDVSMIIYDISTIYLWCILLWSLIPSYLHHKVTQRGQPQARWSWTSSHSAGPDGGSGSTSGAGRFTWWIIPRIVSSL